MKQDVLIQLIRGGGAHTDSLECVRDLTSDLAGRRVGNNPYTVWQLVCHIDYWIQYELDRIAGRRPVYPEHASESWPVEPGPRDAAEWQAEVARFDRLLTEMERLAASDEATLARPVPALHTSHGDRETSLLDVLWQTVVHNSYHVGQVVQVRRMLEAWPPPSGSDTW
jgi:uncharacterized damage-inducible protein DinB